VSARPRPRRRAGGQAAFTRTGRQHLLTHHPPPAAELAPAEEDAQAYKLNSILTFQHLRREAVRVELARLHEELAAAGGEEATEEGQAEEAAAEEAAAEEGEEEVKSS
jgi:hypothetical protein